MVCLPGLEGVVAAELEALGIRSRPAGTGALAARMTDRQLYATNVHLRAATRVLVEVGSIVARSFPVLEERARELDLGPWRAPRQPVRMRVTSHRSRLVHTGAVEERLRRVLDLGAPPAPDDDALLVVVRLDRDTLSLRVDSSGAPLHHRGWRQAAAKAPLRETVAAAALAACGWTPDQPLVDPFCGSGTIPVEAARWAAGLAPGGQRGFAFERWPSFAPGTWASVGASVTATAEPPERPAIGASDRDAGAVEVARQGAARAGVEGWIAVGRASVSDAAPPPGADRPGWIVANPPWGGRIKGGGDLRDLYARLGQVAHSRFPGWGVALLVADPGLAKATGLGGDVALRTRAGPHPVSLVVTPQGTGG